MPLTAGAGLKTLMILFALVTNAHAQADFQVGIYADDARSLTCVSGTAGEEFDQILWAYVPENLELAYLTIRFHFPDNLDLSSRPTFNPQIGTIIFTDYVMNTVEWNMIFTRCPLGWVKVFSQRCVLLDDQPSRIEILSAHSLARDCAFFNLNDVAVVNLFEVNDPECEKVPTAAQGWGTIKALYR